MSNEEHKQKATFSWVSPSDKEGQTNTIVQILEKRYTWEEFSGLISEGRLDKLGRLPEQLAYYRYPKKHFMSHIRSETAKVKEKFGSVEEYLLNKLFNYPTFEKDGKLYAHRPEQVEKVVMH